MKKIIKFGFFLMVYLGYLYLSLSPNTQVIRDSIWYDLGFYILIDVGLLYAMFTPSLKTSLSSKLILGLIFFYPLFHFISISVRDRLLIIFLHGILIILTTVINYYLKYQKNTPKRQFEKYPFIIGLLLLIVSVSTVRNLVYVDEPNLVWWLSLILGVILTVISIFLVRKYKDLIDERQNLYFIPILTMITTFILIVLSSLFLNYSLDRTNPEPISVEIIDMDIDTGGRSLTSYYLTIIIDSEETRIGTTQSRYYQLEIGDEITLYHYKGALGIDYIIYES